MSLTLKDLLVPMQVGDPMQGSRPASLADLVEVLKQEGAEVLEVDRARVWAGKEIWPGRYLILPLGDTHDRP